MEILLNGKAKIFASVLTVEKLLEELRIEPKSVVMELNSEILDKNKYKATYLKEKDQVEIVHFVGGG